MLLCADYNDVELIRHEKHKALGRALAADKAALGGAMRQQVRAMAHGAAEKASPT